MKCHEARRHLDLFMDGELTVPENMKVLEHLNLCRPCAGVYEGEKSLRGVLRADLGSERAPAGLADRALAAAAGPRPAEPESRAPRWGRIAAAAAIFIVLGSLLITPPRESPASVAAAAVAEHERTREGFCGDADPDTMCLCASCTPAGVPALQTMFGKRVPQDPCTHDFRALGYEFTGGCLWSRKAQVFCWTVQKNAAGRILSHSVLYTPVLLGDRPVTVSSGTRTVVMKPRGDSGMT